MFEYRNIPPSERFICGLGQHEGDPMAYCGNVLLLWDLVASVMHEIYADQGY